MANRGTFQDLTGKRFGRLVVKGLMPGKRRRAHWSCLCDCGAETSPAGSKLLHGYTKSCGCGTHQYVPIEERFFAKVNVNGPTMPHMTTPCHVWMGAKAGNGYGRISLHGRLVGAHRVAWMISQGARPAMHVLHKCDNPLCVNPAHLYEGTDADNTRDMISRGRRARTNLDSVYASRRAMTHCKRGHEFTDENMRRYNGCRSCLACQRLRKLERRRDKAEEQKVLGAAG
jgi:hypothetical protein